MKKIVLYFATIIIAVNFNITFAGGVAVVDLDAVLKNSQVWSGVKVDLQDYARSVQKEVMKQQAVLEDIWKQIKDIRNKKLGGKNLIALERSFKQGRMESQEYVQKQKQNMDNAFKNTKQYIDVFIKSAITKVAVEKNYDIVLNAQNTHYYKNSVSITDLIVDILDAELLTIDLKLSDGEKK